jgi:hypothetical protein
MRDVVMYEIAGNGIELFTECVNCLFDRILIYQFYARAIRIYDTSHNGGLEDAYTGNVFRCMSVASQANWNNPSNPYGTPAVLSEVGDAKFINCSFYGDNANQFVADAGTISINNCALHLTHAGNNSYKFINLSLLTSANVLIGSNFNTYDRGPVGGDLLKQDGTDYNLSEFGDWITAGGAGVMDDDSQFTNQNLAYVAPEPTEFTAPDLTLGGSADALLFADATDPDAPTVDLNGNPYTVTADLMDCGAINTS